MQESILDITTRLLRYRRAPVWVTKEFETWKHNKDILPKLQEQLELILGAYGKFQPIVYDTQGILDDGSDLILKHREEGQERESEKLICFQVKSFDDLCKNSYMQELKAQRDDTFRKVHGLEYYFLFLCTNEDRHKNKIRNIAAEFRSAEKTEIIDPAFAYTFLHHNPARVDSFIKRVLEAEDAVFRQALSTIEFLNPSAAALLLFLSVEFSVGGDRNIDQNMLGSSSSLREIYAELQNRQKELLEKFEASQAIKEEYIHEEDYDEDYEEDDWEEDEDEPIQIDDFEQQIANDLDQLDYSFIDLDPISSNIIIHAETVLPLTAIILDAMVRYEYTKTEVLPYLFNLFGVIE